LEKEDREGLIRLLQQEADLAVGCTEAVMVALGAAKIKEVLGGLPQYMEISVSPAVWKSGRRVGLPGTKERGLNMAAALGLFAPLEKGQQLLGHLEPQALERAKGMVERGTIKTNVLLNKEGLYVSIWAWAGADEAKVEMEHSHTRFSKVWKNEKLIFRENRDHPDISSLLAWDLMELWDKVLALPVYRITFLRDKALVMWEFVRDIAGGKVEPLSPLTRFFLQEMGESFAEKVVPLTGMAVAERMAGAPYPVLTSAGSGNQGILISLPLLLWEKEWEESPGRLSQALALAHFTNMYLRAHFGKTSTLCGVVLSGASLAAAVCWLLGGSRRHMLHGVQMFLGNSSCLLCDGAKEACSLKVALAAHTAIIIGKMAFQGLKPEPEAGIIGDTLQETLSLMKKIMEIGMEEIDFYLAKINYLKGGSY